MVRLSAAIASLATTLLLLASSIKGTKLPKGEEKGHCVGYPWCDGTGVKLEQAMDEEASPCDNWDQFVCGKYKRNKRSEHNLRGQESDLGEATRKRDQIHGIIEKILGNPHEPSSEKSPPEFPVAPGNNSSFKKMRQYWDTCLENHHQSDVKIKPIEPIIKKIHNNFKKYESLRANEDGKLVPQFNTSRPIDPSAIKMLQDAQLTLSEYRIWTFASFSPQRSYLDRSKMRPVVTPYIPQGLPRKELYYDDKWIKTYKQVMKSWFKLAYKGRQSIENWDVLVQNVFDTERRILDIAPELHEWRDLKKNLVQATADELRDACPELSLSEVLTNQPGYSKLDTVEVMFPKYWKELSVILFKAPKEVLRAYSLWQLFVQTHFLLQDKPTSGKYATMLRNIRGVREPLTQREYCKDHVFRHFGIIIGSIYANHTNAPLPKKYGGKIAETIRGEFVKEFHATSWMDRDTREKAVNKIKNLKLRLALSDTTSNLINWSDIREYYLGARVGPKNENPKDWSHANDYLALEKWNVWRSWTKDHRRAPDTNRWLLNAWDLDAYYSPQGGHIVTSASMMPIFDQDEEPLYVAYSGYGTAIAEQFMHAFDEYGSQFGANGTLQPLWSPRMAREFHARVKCFENKYGTPGSTGNEEVENYDLGKKLVLGDAIANTHGIDAAYQAWRKTQETSLDKAVEGLEKYTNDQLFFLFRSLRYCSKQQEDGGKGRVDTETELPLRTKVWAPLRDSTAWHEAFDCKPREPVCRLYGEETKYDANYTIAERDQELQRVYDHWDRLRYKDADKKDKNNDTGKDKAKDKEPKISNPDSVKLEWDKESEKWKQEAAKKRVERNR